MLNYTFSAPQMLIWCKIKTSIDILTSIFCLNSNLLIEQSNIYKYYFFSHEINLWKQCSHKKSYCVMPETYRLYFLWLNSTNCLFGFYDEALQTIII